MELKEKDIYCIEIRFDSLLKWWDVVFLFLDEECEKKGGVCLRRSRPFESLQDAIIHAKKCSEEWEKTRNCYDW